MIFSADRFPGTCFNSKAGHSGPALKSIRYLQMRLTKAFNAFVFQHTQSEVRDHDGKRGVCVSLKIHLTVDRCLKNVQICLSNIKRCTRLDALKKISFGKYDRICNIHKVMLHHSQQLNPLYLQIS